MNDRRHQGPERVCPGCGFDLTNPTGPVCPECGGPSSTALHPSVLRRRFPILAILLSAEHALLALGFMAFYAQVTHNGFAAASTSLVFWAIPLGFGVAIVLLLLGGIFRVRLGAAGIVKVVRIKDRFSKPSAGGWRDLMINFVVVSGSDDGVDAIRHVCEVQVAHEMMLTARKGLPGHEVYAVQRNAAEFIESCGLEAELRRAMVQALEKEGKTRMEILSEFEDGWIVEDAEWAAAAGSKEALLKGLEASEEGRLVKVDFRDNKKLTSLPESVGECTGLQTLDLGGCSGLVSLPDLSGLAQLKVHRDLPNHLQPWKASGYKAFSVSNEG